MNAEILISYLVLIPFALVAAGYLSSTLVVMVSDRPLTPFFRQMVMSGQSLLITLGVGLICSGLFYVTGFGFLTVAVAFGFVIYFLTAMLYGFTAMYRSSVSSR
jgi:glucan phosphoethanolaminetransferase (alkaline phosphatase superfamily)